MPHAQSWMPKALGVMLWPAHPAAQKPEQALPGVVERAAVGGAQGGVAGLKVHQVIKALDQRLDVGFAAYPGEGGVERGGAGGLFFDLHGCGVGGRGRSHSPQRRRVRRGSGTEVKKLLSYLEKAKKQKAKRDNLKTHLFSLRHSAFSAPLR